MPFMHFFEPSIWLKAGYGPTIGTHVCELIFSRLICPYLILNGRVLNSFDVKCHGHATGLAWQLLNMRSDHQWFVWADCDTLYANMGKKLPDLLEAGV